MSDNVPVNIAYLRGQVEHFEKLFDECALARDSAGYVGTVPECIQHLNADLMAAYKAIHAIWTGHKTAALNGGGAWKRHVEPAIYEAAKLLPLTWREREWLGGYTQEMTDEFTREQWEPPKPEAIDDQFEDLLG